MKLAMAWASWTLAVLAASAAFTEQQVLDHARDRPVNVAIIGAGAGGSSAAYHLAKFAESHSLLINITVFERNAYIGGRTTTVSAYNDTSLPVELGGSIFVQANRILVDAVKEFNLSTSFFSKKRDVQSTAPQVGIWDGQKFHVTYSGSYWDLAKLFWKYGLAPGRTQNLMKKTVGKFERMYDAPVFPFASLTKAAQDVGLLAVTAATGEEYMRENGITGPFGKDVVQASTRVNYAQNLGYIHGLEAMVCMATDGAMQVEGGNWQIFGNMIAASGATTLMSTEVTGVSKQKDGGYVLTFRRSDSKGYSYAETEQHFDAIVLATPYQFTNLSLVNLPATTRIPDKLPYVTLHVTLFTSPHTLSPEFFNLPANQPAPPVVLTTLPVGEPAKKGPAGVGSPGFFSISTLRPITNPHTGAQELLYKIFSPAPASAAFIAEVLGVEDLPGDGDGEISERDVTWMYREVWQSYPYEFPRVTFEEAELESGLWYTGGMDSFISTMETNALMGRNVAALMVDRTRGQRREGKAR